MRAGFGLHVAPKLALRGALAHGARAFCFSTLNRRTHMKSKRYNIGLVVSPNGQSVKIRFIHHLVSRGKNVVEWVDLPKGQHKKLFEAVTCDFARRF
jgi:hypothetical protein